MFVTNTSLRACYNDLCYLRFMADIVYAATFKQILYHVIVCVGNQLILRKVLILNIFHIDI